MKGIALVPVIISLTGCGCFDATCGEYAAAPVTPCCATRSVVVSQPCCTSVVVARPVVTKACCDTCYDATCH